jgi:hypothetical protein
MNEWVRSGLPLKHQRFESASAGSRWVPLEVCSPAVLPTAQRLLRKDTVHFNLASKDFFILSLYLSLA